MPICFHLFSWVVFFFFNQVPRSLCMPHGLLVLALSHPWDTTTMARNLMERNPHLPLLGLAGSWQPCESNNEKVRQWKRRHTQPKVTAKLLHRFQQLHWGLKSLKASVSSYMWLLPCTRKPQATDSWEGADDSAIWGRTWLEESVITIPYFSFPTKLVYVKGTGLTSQENSCLLINYN